MARKKGISSKLTTKNTLIILGFFIGIVIISSMFTQNDNGEFDFGFFGLSETFTTLTTSLSFLTDDDVTKVFQVIQGDTLNAHCDLKMFTQGNYLTGGKVELNSAFDNPISQILSQFSLVSRSSGDTLKDYDNEVRIFCNNIKDSNGNIVATKVTPVNMKITTFAKDPNGNDILISTKSVTPRGNAGSSSTTTMNTNTHGFGEFTIGTAKILATEIDNKLPEQSDVYRTQVRHVLEGKVSIEIPLLTQELGKKHEAIHQVSSNKVANYHFINVDKVPDSGIGLGGGTTVTIVSYDPKVIDSSTNADRRIQVDVKLDGWSNEEGLPWIEVFDGSDRIGRSQMSFDRVVETGKVSGLDDFFFKGFYTVPINTHEGTFEIKALSNTLLGGLLARPLSTPTVNFVVDNSSTVCNSGFELIGEQCIIMCPAGTTPSVFSGGGIFDDTQKCVINECPDGKVLENGICVDKPITSCPQGQHLDNGVCVDNTLTCSPTHILVGDQCIPKECQSGFVRNAENQCVADNCPSGQVRNSAGTCEVLVECTLPLKLIDGVCKIPQQLISCEDGSTVPITSECPETTGEPDNGACSADMIDENGIQPCLDSVGLGGNNLLFVIAGVLVLILIIAIAIRPSNRG
jgi:hypothetical protein